jgi:DNA-binding response OmpR family regulator
MNSTLENFTLIQLKILTFNDEEPIKLSPKENELLKMLILHNDQ